MAEVEDRLVVRMEATLARFEKQMARARQAANTNATGIEERFDRMNSRMAQSSEKAARGLSSVVNISSRGRFVIQNTAAQLGDMAVQLESGTSASRVLAQQVPQMLGAFGALGAILGTVVAIGVPLAAQFINIGDAGQSLEERTKSLQKAVDEYRNAAERANLPTADLAKKYGRATEAARQFLAALSAIDMARSTETIGSRIDELAGRFGEFEGTFSSPGPLGSGNRQLDNLTETLRAMSSQLSITLPQASEFAMALKAVGEAEGPKEQLEAVQALEAAIKAALGPFEGMSEEAQAFYVEVVQAGEALAQMVGVGDNIAGGISRAASEAGRLADELGRAVNNAINLAAQGISDVQRAKIEYDFRDDPVGRARALAGARFDAQTNLPEGAPGFVVDQVSDEIQRERQEFVGAAAAAEEYRQKLIAWQREQTKNNKGGGNAGGGRKRGANDEFFANSDEQLLNLERQIDLIGKTGREVAELNAKYRLLDEAKRKGLDLDKQAAGTGETLRQQIDRQAEAIGALTEKYDRAQERADFFEQAQQDLKDGFIDAIIEGENLSGVLENVAKAFARAALQAALFNEGPFSSGGGGGGILGSIFGAVFGKRASGGPVAAGRPYLVNENTPNSEVFVPAQNGGILNVSQAQAALRGAVAGGGGGSSVVRVELSPDLVGAILAEARGQSVQITRQGMGEYSRSVAPGRQAQIARDPRRRG